MLHATALRSPGGEGGPGMGSGLGNSVRAAGVAPVATAPPSGLMSDGSPVPGSKIRAFDQGLSGAKGAESWKRKPTVTGNGAVHCKSFHAKLTGESLEYLDKQINDWLDAHPDYEVKLVTSTIGEWTGKLKEPNLIVQVWV